MHTKKTNKCVVAYKKTYVVKKATVNNTVTQHNINNSIVYNVSIAQLYNNKQLYNMLTSNLQTVVKLYKHYTCSLAQLNNIHYYATNSSYNAYNTNTLVHTSCVNTTSSVKVYKNNVNNAHYNKLLNKM